MRLAFTKMHGAGNDFVVLDGTTAPLQLTPAQAQRLGDRRFGVGADQILIVERSNTPGIDFRYRIYNNSGDEVEHCGNGARCFVRYVHERGLTDKTTILVETVNNVLELRLREDGRVTVDMNRPVFEHARIPFDASGLAARGEGGFELWPLEGVELAVLSMGNPHAVQRVADVDHAPVAAAGPGHRAAPAFRAQGQRRLPAGDCRPTRCGCACTSAAPARRWPAAPAPAPRSSPASAWAGWARAWKCTRAAATLLIEWAGGDSQRLHDRPRGHRLHRSHRTVSEAVNNPGVQGITEQDIANYLANNPGFFERHAELLGSVQLTSPHGQRAVSLQERQMEMLRERIKGLEQKIVEMIRNSQENVAIADRLHRYTRSILLTADASELPGRMVATLKHEFLIPQAAIRLWGVEAPHNGATYAEPASDDVKSFAASLTRAVLRRERRLRGQRVAGRRRPP